MGASQLEALLLAEVRSLNSKRGDYHPYDHIAHIGVVSAGNTIVTLVN